MKNSSRGPKHGQSERQNYVLQGERHAEKSKELEERKSSDDSLQVESTRKLPDFVSEEQYWRKRNDQFALENHDYTATKAERTQNSKHWVLSINAEGSQLPRQQRPDYAAAKREYQRPQDEYMAETKQFYEPLHPSKQMRQNPNQQFEGSEDYDYVVDRKTVWKWYTEQQGNLPHTSSSSSSSWQNSSWQIWNSWWWHTSKPDEGQ